MLTWDNLIKYASTKNKEEKYPIRLAENLNITFTAENQMAQDTLKASYKVEEATCIHDGSKKVKALNSHKIFIT